ncbi:MAG: hypothetical protein Q7S76_04575 [bacterium]|nr:hypothetical protein [bacterium]
MSEQFYHHKKWTPKAVEAAEKLIRKIHNLAPELEVTLMGAVPLKINGRNDLDIDILCPREKLMYYKGVFERTFGPALVDLKDTEYWAYSNDEVYWEFERDGFVADIMLHDPTTTHFRVQTKRHKKLSDNPELLAQYKILKNRSDGLPIAEYERRKLTFFENVVDKSEEK